MSDRTIGPASGIWESIKPATWDSVIVRWDGSPGFRMSPAPPSSGGGWNGVTFDGYYDRKFSLIATGS